MLLKLQSLFSFKSGSILASKTIPFFFLFCSLIFASQTAETFVHEETAPVPHLSISLFNSEVKAFEDALTAEAQVLMQQPQSSSFYLQNFDILDGHGCMVIETEKSTFLPWTEVLQRYLQDSEQDTVTLGKVNRQKSGLVLIREGESKRIFVFKFGEERDFIRLEKCDPSFGLRVVCNTLAQAESPKVDSPLLKTTALLDFNAKRLSSSGSNLVCPFELSVAALKKLPELCLQLMALFLKEDYKERYGWIDHIMLITNSPFKKQLIELLVSEIKKPDFQDRSCMQLKLLPEASVGAAFKCIDTEQGASWQSRSLPHQQDQVRVAIVIDAFRAFATASYVLERSPASYKLTTKTSVISRLASCIANSLMIGKPEKGVDFTYDIPNSPTRVKGVNVTGRNVLHRTEAGAKGILLVQDADIILAAGFGNADATVRYIKTLKNPKTTLIPMGHEATTPSIEDHICALYIESLLRDERMKLEPYLPTLRRGPGQYFFSEDQWQYPHDDFKRCLKIGRFNFPIQAVVSGDYAILTRCEKFS